MRSDSRSIDAYQLERILREAGVEPAAPVRDGAAEPGVLGDEQRYLRPLAEQVAELEQRAIAAALKAHGGNKQATARQLGISRATLYGRLENPE
jgi:DNA-binding NtrC family response regulator